MKKHGGLICVLVFMAGVFVGVHFHEKLDGIHDSMVSAYEKSTEKTANK